MSVYRAHNSLKRLLQCSKGLAPTVANVPQVCLSFDFKLGQIEALLERTIDIVTQTQIHTSLAKYIRQYMKQQNGSIPAKSSLADVEDTF